MHSPVVLWYHPENSPSVQRPPDFQLIHQALAVAGFEHHTCRSPSQLLSKAGRLAQQRPAADGRYAWMVAVLCSGMAENAALAHLLRTEQPQMGILAMLPDLEEETQLMALQSGIDAWFTPATSQRLMMATVFSLLRRMGSVVPCDPGIDQSRRWSLREHAWKLRSPEGDEFTLTTTERAFLLALASSEGRSATHEHLADRMGGLGDKTDEGRRERISVIVSRLRRKCEVAGADLPVRSVHGKGYVFADTLGDVRIDKV